ncbi:glycosyltransferase [Amnibacterium endophyticum]|uniref:Glycosyltransferase n=1 Tax=Amnibacterium endophyticum TaxID=2109337 RepID=A0ABW4LCG6_9MICO
MHNVFSAELRRRRLSRLRLLLALANPTRAMRVLKEHILAAPIGRRTFVAVSSQAVPEVEELTRGRHHVAAIPNAIDLDRFHPAGEEDRREARMSFKVQDGTRAVGFIGHEFKRKGLPELILGFALLPADFELFVAGGESQNIDAFQHLVDEAGVSSRVHFLGTVEDTPAFLRAMDVFCLPSHYEGTPMVALEALATGLPAVLSEHCPVDELLNVGVNGFACRVDPRDIADQLLAANSLGTDPQAIRSTVQDRTWRAAAVSYLELLDGTPAATTAVH